MLKKFFSHTESSLVKPLVVVSGLPRSGTSMMMKMLAEGGLDILSDSFRTADEDNPNGYFEIERSKNLRDGDKTWLKNAQGKAVKVISYLLEFLPDDLNYDIIFMEREIGEILASQKKMLQRRNEAPKIPDVQMEAEFREHLRAVKYWLARKPNMRVTYIKYNEMIAEPEAFCASIAEFLKLPLNIHAMKSVPDHALYRNRS